MAKRTTVIWAKVPAPHDYPAAASYLSMLATPTQVDVLVALLTRAETMQHPAKDILRAARLPLLGADDPEVAKDLKRVAKGVALSPVLLVRGELGRDVALQIADGYHRICASYLLNENTEIACRIVHLPAIAV